MLGSARGQLAAECGKSTVQLWQCCRHIQIHLSMIYMIKNGIRLFLPIKTYTG